MTLDGLEVRLAALEDRDFEAVRDTLGDVFASPDVEALETLGLVERDCQALLSDPGPPSEHAAFVVALHTEDPLPQDDAHREAVEKLAEEWELTLDDLRAVGTDDVPDEAAWQSLIEAVEATVDRYRARADALESGDDDEIAEAFRPAETDVALLEWEGSGLDRRDCRLVRN